MGEMPLIKGRNANYKVAFGSHGSSEMSPEGIDAVIFEGAVLRPNDPKSLERSLNGDRKIRMEKKLRDEFERLGRDGKEIWLADLHYDSKWKHLRRRYTGRAALAARLPFSIIELITGCPLSWKGKIVKREKLRKFWSIINRKAFPMGYVAGRSAFIALKAERYIGPFLRRSKGLDRKPVIGISIDFGHPELVEYLKNSKEARKMVVSKFGEFKRNHGNINTMIRLIFDPVRKKWTVEKHKYNVQLPDGW